MCEDSYLASAIEFSDEDLNVMFEDDESEDGV